MLNKLRASLSYANVTATMAIFVALGGTSYAVATGSIDSREIKNNGVRSKDIRNNDVRSKDIRDRSLLRKDFKSGQLPAGPQGPKGDKGDTGPSGLPPKQTLEISALSADLSGAAVRTGAGCVDFPNAGGQVSLDLPLPAGAQITAIRARYIDTTAANILQIGVHHVDFDGSASQQILLGGGSSDTPSEGLTTLTADPGVTLPRVSDTSYYDLYAKPAFSDPAPRLAFCGVAVDYTLD
jgi:hypothetical protein